MKEIINKHINRLEIIEKKVKEIEHFEFKGEVTGLTGLIVHANGPKIPVGSFCKIFSPDETKLLGYAEVVGFDEKGIFLMTYGKVEGISIGSIVKKESELNYIPVGYDLLGKVIDPFGNVLNSTEEYKIEDKYPLYPLPYNPLERERIRDVLDVGVKAINALFTVGKGQRIGIFAGSGVGKSTLLGMMAKHTTADVNVVALIGERGREVREFIERDLGGAMNKTVVIVATSDTSPLERIRGAYAAMSIAEFFRDAGKDVLFIMDSITRFAMAMREIGLSIGEPPTTKGYTPSVFSNLPKLLERAGNFKKRGSITAFFTVLVESDDFNEPISDAVRAIIDGHIYLSRELANKGHYPAIDILGSLSRLMPDLVDKDHLKAAQKMISTFATYKNAEDLINIGAYAEGSNPGIDYAISKIDSINEFLRQARDERFSFEESKKLLFEIVGD